MKRLGPSIALLAAIAALFIISASRAEAYAFEQHAHPVSVIALAASTPEENGGWSDEATVNTAGFAILGLAGASAIALQSSRERKKTKQQERQWEVEVARQRVADARLALTESREAVDVIVKTPRRSQQEYVPDEAALRTAVRALARLDTQTSDLLGDSELFETYRKLALDLISYPDPTKVDELTYGRFRKATGDLARLIDQRLTAPTARAASPAQANDTPSVA